MDSRIQPQEGAPAAQQGLQRAEMEQAVARRRQSVEQKQQQNEQQAPDKKKLTPDSLRQQLFEREERIQRRIEAIQNEAFSAADDARDAVFRNPRVSVGGALAAGLAVGLLLGKPARPAWYDNALGYAPKRYRKQLEGWAQAAEREARKAARKGEDAVHAVRLFAADHEPPLAPMSDAPRKEKEGLIKGIILSAATTALSSMAKRFVDDIMNSRTSA